MAKGREPAASASLCCSASLLQPLGEIPGLVTPQVPVQLPPGTASIGAVGPMTARLVTCAQCLRPSSPRPSAPASSGNNRCRDDAVAVGACEHPDRLAERQLRTQGARRRDQDRVECANAAAEIVGEALIGIAPSLRVGFSARNAPSPENRPEARPWVEAESSTVSSIGSCV